jgi:hypothetical protein
MDANGENVAAHASKQMVLFRIDDFMSIFLSDG